MVLWLNGEGKNMNEVIGSGIAASHMGENLQSRLEKPNQCLGLIIYNENSLTYQNHVYTYNIIT